MLKLTPDQENQACEALVKLGWLETEQGLHSEGVLALQDALQCSIEDARSVLRDLRVRKLVDSEISPGGQSDAQKPVSVAPMRWIRPAAGE